MLPGHVSLCTARLLCALLIFAASCSILQQRGPLGRALIPQRMETSLTHMLCFSEWQWERAIVTLFVLLPLNEKTSRPPPQVPVILDLAYKAVQRLKGLPRFNTAASVPSRGSQLERYALTCLQPRVNCRWTSGMCGRKEDNKLTIQPLWSSPMSFSR